VSQIVGRPTIEPNPYKATTYEQSRPALLKRPHVEDEEFLTGATAVPRIRQSLKLRGLLGLYVYTAAEP